MSGGPTTYDTAILARRQEGEQVIRELGLKCTPDGVTDTQLDWTGLERRHNKPDGWWMAAGAYFEGEVVRYNEYGELSAPGRVEITVAQASLCVFDGRLLVTVQPQDDESAPWVWLGENVEQIAVETSGSRGLSGRPFEITLRNDDWTLKVIAVARLFRRWKIGSTIDESFQAVQEKSLVSVLGDAVGVEQRFPMERLDVAELSDSSAYEWRREPQLADLHHLHRAGEPSVVTWLVDRSRPAEEQVEALEQIDWLPGFLTRRLIEQARGERKQAALWFPELPPGRLLYPYVGIAPVISVDGDEASHPVRDYLWPSIEGEGEPVLDDGEEIARRFSASAVQCNFFRAASPNGVGRSTEDEILGSSVYLTNRRLLVVSKLDPAGRRNEAGASWAVGHLRWEWVSSIGTLCRQRLKRAGFLGGKEALVGEREGLFVRETFPNDEACEFWFPAEPGQAGPVEELIGEIADLVERASGRVATAPENDVDLTEFAERRIRTTTPIPGAVPYSIPDRLV